MKVKNNKNNEMLSHKTRCVNRHGYVICFNSDFGFSDVSDSAIDLLQTLEDLSPFADWSRPADTVKYFAHEVLSANLPFQFLKGLEIDLCVDDNLWSSTYEVIARFRVIDFFNPQN